MGSFLVKKTLDMLWNFCFHHCILLFSIVYFTILLLHRSWLVENPCFIRIWPHHLRYIITPVARVFFISIVFSNARRVLSQCNTPLRLLYLVNSVLHTKLEPKNGGSLHVVGPWFLNCGLFLEHSISLFVLENAHVVKFGNKNNNFYP